VQDVAQRYGVTEQTVTYWIREGRFPNAHWLNGAGVPTAFPSRTWSVSSRGDANGVNAAPANLLSEQSHKPLGEGYDQICGPGDRRSALASPKAVKVCQVLGDLPWR
jgi:hypothetical protein